MRRLAILCAVIIALGVFSALHSVEVLTLTREDRVIWVKRVNPGDRFQLSFLHSIALSEVRDFFTIDSQYRIVLTESRFQGQGTGLPSHPAPGEKLERQGDWFCLSGIRRVLPSVSWRVQRPWQNRFRFGEWESDFSSLMGGALIQIQVQKMTLASFCKNRLQNFIGHG